MTSEITAKRKKSSRVILLADIRIRDDLADFCNNYISPDGIKTSMGVLTDVAVREKLNKLKQTWKKIK